MAPITHRLFFITMNRIFSMTLVALLGGVLVTSCVPHDEYGRRVDKKKTQGNLKITDPKQQEINAKREEMRLRDEQRRKELGLPPADLTTPQQNALSSSNGAEMITDSVKPKTTTPPKNHPVAAAVPGKPGFVFSPFNHKVVDVRGIASGTLVADPQYPPADKKHFRVP